MKEKRSPQQTRLNQPSGCSHHRTGDRNTFRTDCGREYFPWKRGSVYQIWYQKYSSNEQESPGISGRYGFNYIDATKVIDDYNFEDRKLVEIVKSTYFNPKVLVVDETTTALGQKGREELFKVMHKVRDTGNCVSLFPMTLRKLLSSLITSVYFEMV